MSDVSHTLKPHVTPSSYIETWSEFLQRIAKQYWLQEHDHDKLLKLADIIEFHSSISNKVP